MSSKEVCQLSPPFSLPLSVADEEGQVGERGEES